MPRLTDARLRKLRDLASHGNQDAIALIEGGDTITDQAGCKVLMSAGDEDAAQHSESIRACSRQKNAEQRAKAKELSTSSTQRPEGSIASGDQDALSARETQRAYSARHRAAQRAKVAAGDPVAIAARDRRQASERRRREAVRAKAAAGDPEVISVLKQNRVDQKASRAALRARAAAGDADAVAKREAQMEHRRHWLASKGGVEYGRARKRERRDQRAIRIVEGFGYIAPSSESRREAGEDEDEGVDEDDEDDEENEDEDEEEEELADWMAGSGRQWNGADTSNLTPYQAEKAKRDAGDAAAIAKYQKQLLWNKQYSAELRELAAAGDAVAAAKIGRRKDQSRKAHKRNALEVVEGFDGDSCVLSGDGDSEDDDEEEEGPLNGRCPP